MHPELSKAYFDDEVVLLTPAFLKAKRWALHSSTYPVLDVEFFGVEPLRLRMICDGWPELPPQGELLTSAGAYLTTGVPGGVFNPSSHPATGRPFICMRGFREFHTHPSHQNETWDSYRGQEGMNLVGLLSQISSAWRKAKGK